MGRKVIKNNKEQWVEEYTTREWLKRRSQILKRDKHSCVKCSSIENLQVHHRIYDITLHVWEYTDEYLITLCKDCHKKTHEEREISTFYSREQLPKFNIKRNKEEEPKKKLKARYTKRNGAYATSTYYPDREKKE